MSNFDSLLHRKLSNESSLINDLFPATKNTTTNLGLGNTHHTVHQMKKWVELHYHQTDKVAKLLKRATLKETVNLIYSFLYNTLQYKQDYTLQQLRSPSNSIRNRKTGLDCKSYSIFASCILTSLGIKHFIRQIKQPHFKPTRFTHVYVVVPINQETANLNDGYYPIDGTVKGNREPLFITTNDTFMDKLPHVGLNGAKKASKTKSKKKPVATKRKKPVATKKKKSTNMVRNAVIGLGTIAVVSQLLK
ncbi:transglutaminase-like domain-containing protein [Flavobacterium sp. GCM10027622]|uniref:transglutaminase-like domain-containing protein n=1 Tax=unclassified Flavobacterium TaxID=196869 RepID=UPI00361889EB